MSSQKLLIFIYLLYRLKFWEGYDIMIMTRSDKIKAGLQRSFQSGKSAKASIVCYGYRVDSKGKLQIYPVEAAHVLFIFERFASGNSLGKISDALFLMDIPSPTGKEIWSKETISKILSNEKYAGDVTLGKTKVKNGVQVKTTDLSTTTTLTSHHPAIISRELFDSVQKEKSRRHRLRER
jgi:hypothetical protein